MTHEQDHQFLDDRPLPGRCRWQRQIVTLLTAIEPGTLTGWGYARWSGMVWQPPAFRTTRLVAFPVPSRCGPLSDELAAWSLIGSQVVLLALTFLNLHLPGMPLLMLGLGWSLGVILANRGFKSLTSTAVRLVDRSALRILRGKPGSSTDKVVRWLPCLAGCYASPSFARERFAFCGGDGGVVAGTFWQLPIGQLPTTQTN